MSETAIKIVRDKERCSEAWRGSTLVWNGPAKTKSEMMKFFKSDNPEYAKAWFNHAEQVSGLSRNHFVQLWKKRVNEGSNEPLFLLKNSPGQYPLSLNLRLSGAPEVLDPIVATIPLIEDTFQRDESTFLRDLFLDLLKVNDLLDPRNSTQRVEKWEPYGWSRTRPFVAMKPTDYTFVGFHFLKEGPFKGEVDVCIRFSDKYENHQLAAKRLPEVCQALTCHSYPDFFKLLYMSFLRKNQVVTEEASLVENWKETFSSILIDF